MDHKLNTNLKRIVWLASYPKSGNTWFRVFLENAIAPSGTSKGINQLEESTIASSRFLIDHLAGISSSELTADETEELRPRVYRKLAEIGEDIQFLKVHDAWKKTPSGESMFPEEVTKGVIYIVRNPLDVAVSFAHHASKKIGATIRDMNNTSFSFCDNPQKKDHQVKQILSSWSGHVISWIDKSGLPIHVIRYEDMLEDSFNTFKKALEFLNIPIKDDKLRQSIESSDFHTLKEMESTEGFKEKPINLDSFFREGQAGNWQDSLNPSQIAAVVHTHKNQMIRFKYLPYS